MHRLLTIILLASPLRSDGEVRVGLRATVGPTPAVVLFDSTGDGRRDSFREGCVITMADDTLTAVCPPLDTP